MTADDLRGVLAGIAVLCFLVPLAIFLARLNLRLWAELAEERRRRGGT